MRRIIIVGCLMFSVAFSAKSQFNTELGVNLGASDYLGDIGGGSQTAKPWILDIKPQETREALGLYVRQKLSSNFYFEGQLNYIKITGADSLSTNRGRLGRNLYFRNNIFEASALCDWVFFQITDIGGYFNYKTTFSAYLTAGVSVFHHDPQAIYAGQWVDLEPLKLDGNSFSLIQPGIPMGVGFFYTFNRQYRLGWNLIWTKTFTNYLDDVGDKYVPQEANTEAAYLENRSLLVPGMKNDPEWQENYLPGQKRGDGSSTESFLTTQISFGYVFKSGSHKGQHKSLFDYKSRSSF